LGSPDSGHITTRPGTDNDEVIHLFRHVRKPPIR
jgi:hypothetical protein